MVCRSAVLGAAVVCAGTHGGVSLFVFVRVCYFFALKNVSIQGRLA